MSSQVPPTLGDIIEDMKKNLTDIFGRLTNKTKTNIIIPERNKEPMTEKEYNEIEAVRRSDLLKLRKSPLHYWWAKNNPEPDDSPAKIFGSACHKYVLEGAAAFGREYAVAPAVDRRTKQGKEEWEIFKLENEGKTVISPDDFERIRDMKRALREHPTAMTLLSGDHEQSYVWTDDETGEKCKIRVDCVSYEDSRPILVDYKTVRSCEDGVFERECRSFGYKIQAGMYTEGFTLNTFLETTFIFVCQEKDAPYAVRVYYCDPGFIDQGREQFHTLLRYFHQCRTENNWPGYTDGYLTADEWEEVAE